MKQVREEYQAWEKTEGRRVVHFILLMAEDGVVVVANGLNLFEYICNLWAWTDENSWCFFVRPFFLLYHSLSPFIGMQCIYQRSFTTSSPYCPIPCFPLLPYLYPSYPSVHGHGKFSAMHHFWIIVIVVRLLAFQFSCSYCNPKNVTLNHIQPKSKSLKNEIPFGYHHFQVSC